MTLKEVYYSRGLDGLLEYLQPYVDQIDELTKPATTPASPEEAEEKEEDTDNG